jgi:hypothetical protein
MASPLPVGAPFPERARALIAEPPEHEHFLIRDEVERLRRESGE